MLRKPGVMDGRSLWNIFKFVTAMIFCGLNKHILQRNLRDNGKHYNATEVETVRYLLNKSSPLQTYTIGT